jgi:hypothetical protein
MRATIIFIMVAAAILLGPGPTNVARAEQPFFGIEITVEGPVLTLTMSGPGGTVHRCDARRTIRLQNIQCQKAAEDGTCQERVSVEIACFPPPAEVGFIPNRPPLPAPN